MEPDEPIPPESTRLHFHRTRPSSHRSNSLRRKRGGAGMRGKPIQSTTNDARPRALAFGPVPECPRKSRGVPFHLLPTRREKQTQTSPVSRASLGPWRPWRIPAATQRHKLSPDVPFCRRPYTQSSKTNPLRPPLTYSRIHVIMPVPRARRLSSTPRLPATILPP